MYNLSRENNFVKLSGPDGKTRYFKVEDFLAMIVLDDETISFRCPGFVKENISFDDVKVNSIVPTSMYDLVTSIETLGIDNSNTMSVSFAKKLAEFETGSKVISIEPFREILNNDNGNLLLAEDENTFFYGKLLTNTDIDIYNSVEGYNIGTHFKLSDQSAEVFFAAINLDGDPGDENVDTAIFTGYKIKVQPFNIALDLRVENETATVSGAFGLDDVAIVTIDWGDGSSDQYSGDADSGINFSHDYDGREGPWIYTIKIYVDVPAKINAVELNGDPLIGCTIIDFRTQDIATNGALNEINLQNNNIPSDDLIKLLNDLDFSEVENGSVEINSQNDLGNLDPDIAAIANLEGKGWIVNFDSI